MASYLKPAPKQSVFSKFGSYLTSIPDRVTKSGTYSPTYKKSQSVAYGKSKYSQVKGATADQGYENVNAADFAAGNIPDWAMRPAARSTQDILASFINPVSYSTGGGAVGMTPQEQNLLNLQSNQANQNAGALEGYLGTQEGQNQKLLDLIAGRKSDITGQTQAQIDLLNQQKPTLEGIAGSGYEAQRAGLGQQKEDVKSSYTEALNKLNSEQEKQRLQLENTLTSRGASESTFGEIQRTNLSDRFADALSSLTKQQTQELGRIDTAMNTLESQAKDAVNQVDVNIQNTLLQLQQARDNNLKALEQQSIEQLANFEGQKFDLSQQIKSITDQRDTMIAQAIAEASRVTGGSTNVTNLASQLLGGNVKSINDLFAKLAQGKKYGEAYRGYLEQTAPELASILDQIPDENQLLGYSAQTTK